MISIVVPVYNNADTLEDLTFRIKDTLSNESFEIIFINDGSTDNSLGILKQLTKTHPSVCLISFSRNFGQHSAISAGFERAKGDIIVLMDADLQDRPENIGLLLSHLDKDEVDIVYTTKKEDVVTFSTQIASNIYHLVFSKIVKVDVPRNIGTFRVFKRKVLDALLKYRESNILYGPLMFYIGFKYVFVAFDRDKRLHGSSAYTFSKRLMLATNSLMSYTNLPYRIFSFVGLLFLVSSFAYGLIVIVEYFLFSNELPKGFTLVIVFLSFLTGSTMFSFGILGNYLFRVFQEVLRRPRYIIDEIIESREWRDDG